MNKKLIWIILINLIYLSGFSQINLVKNESFEEKIGEDFRCGLGGFGGCSSSGCNDPRTGAGCCCCEMHLLSNDLPEALNPNQDIPFVKEWNNVLNHNATPDYFNSCAPDQNPGNVPGCGLCFDVHVPDNGFGNQLARTGNAYTGILARSTSSTACGNNMYSEYIKVKLKSPLTAGVRYAAKMYVSLADNSQYACAGLSMLFTTSEVNGGGTSCIITHNPQLRSNVVITDKSNWVKIEGDFYASGGEEWLTIGVFDDGGLSFPVIQPTGFEPSAYYYIDDVVVVADGDNCCPDFQLYEANTNLPTETNVKDYIKAGNDVGIPSITGNVIVQSTDNVTFEANNYIELLPGFEVESGGIFSAKIEECNNLSLYPYDITLDYINNAYPVNCPGSKFWFGSTGAHTYQFQLFDRWGNKMFDHSGSVVSNNMWVFEGTFDGSYTWPNYQGVPDVITYSLKLSGSCSDDEIYGGTISPVYPSCKTGDDNSGDSSKTNIPTNITSVEAPDQSLYIYPNPNAGTFTIRISENIKGSELEIRNVLGSLITSLKSPSSSFEVDLTSQPKGVFFVKLFSSEGEVLKIEKVVVQ